MREIERGYKILSFIYIYTRPARKVSNLICFSKNLVGKNEAHWHELTVNAGPDCPADGIGALQLVAVPQSQETIERNVTSDKRGHYGLLGILSTMGAPPGEVWGVPGRLL